MTHKLEVLLDRAIGPLYEAVIEATEEAILNALCMADDMTRARRATSRRRCRSTASRDILRALPRSASTAS